MNHSDLDQDLRLTAQRVEDMTRRVAVDRHHMRQLHAALMQRHRELTRPEVRHVRHRPGLGFLRVRFALAAPPALAAVLAVLFVLLQPAGRQPVPVAGAAGLNAALARSAPTVTAWQVTVQTQRPDSADSYQCVVPLRASQHLFIRNGQPFLFSAGTWWRVTYHDSGRGCPSSYQWAFAQIAQHLVRRDFVILSNRQLRGLSTVGLRYASRDGGGNRVVATAWVDRSTGLLTRLERRVFKGQRVVESDFADYSYQRAS
jgi:hypothetical protein